MYDVLVVGGGPTGLAAALYTGRALLKTAVIERLQHGGQIALTNDIENYPGFPEAISGPELTRRMKTQAEKFGAEMLAGEVKGFQKNGKAFVLQTGGDPLEAKALILATGADPRLLDCPGEKTYTGFGVSYCATCDGAFFRDQKVFVVGGGDAAVEEGTFLTRFASSVTIVHRRDELRASPVVQQRAFDNPKIDFRWNAVVEEILGEGTGDADKKVTGVRLKDVKTGEVHDEETDGVFVFIGHIPNTGWLKGVVDLDEHGLIKVDLNMRTSLPGVFACGDNRVGAKKQLASSCGDGVTAALEAQHYVESLE